MENKLQELTDRLYNEGLSKGRREGEEILEKARKEAEAIIAGAKSEAESIVAKATREAAELKAKVESDVRMAAAESITATKQDIEKLLVGNICSKGVDRALGSADFIKELISAVAAGFGKDENADLDIVLPETLKDKIEPFLKNELAGQLGAGIKASFSKKTNGGFTIGPSGEGWFIDFTDESFKQLISAYLRPATRKLLFG